MTHNPPLMLALLTTVATFVGACSAEHENPVVAPGATPITLATPRVSMAADPPPPFTYWAPEGATIRNHPRDPGAWLAESRDGSRKFYFGDQCRASEHQVWIGQSVDALPQAPRDQNWRVACKTCAVTSDMRRDRLNISYDEATRRIFEVSCG